MAGIRLSFFAILVAVLFAAAPLTARADTTIPEPDVDLYYAGAVTAGIVVGSAIAVIVTDGLIVPVVTGVGAGALDPLLTGAAGIFGAVVGGLYASDWYERENSLINVSW